MADIHVVSGDGNNLWSIVMHFAVPNTNNAIGVNHRTALVNSGIGGTTSLPDGDGTNGTISTTEKPLVESGEVHEHIVNFLAESGGSTTVELRNALRAFYASEKTRIIDDLQRRLKYFGHTESES